MVFEGHKESAGGVYPPPLPPLQPGPASLSPPLVAPFKQRREHFTPELVELNLLNLRLFGRPDNFNSQLTKCVGNSESLSNKDFHFSFETFDS